MFRFFIIISFLVYLDRPPFITSIFALGQKQESSIEENMILVEGGTFQMGQNDPNIACGECTKDEQPIHKVTVSSFYIGKYEVTQKEWIEIMGGENPSYGEECADCPVDGVSWIDVQMFIKKLNEKTGKNFRLPTEVEWEFAARGGNKSQNLKFSGSNTASDVAWYSLKTDKKIHPVGQKKPNELGLFDMSGNVWEWCNDFYDGNYYSNSPASNPKGPDKGKDRVLRGGSWYSQSNDIRIATRYRFFPNFRTNANGFRLVLPI